MIFRKLALIVFVGLLAACGADNKSGGDSTTVESQDSPYAGSSACKGCHQEIYDKYVKSGHKFALVEVTSNDTPIYPYSSIAGALEQIDNNGSETENPLGTPESYDDVSYVIGGYGWKASWIDRDGYIVSGAQSQFNLEHDKYVGSSMMSSPELGDDDGSFNCGNCHTTGWKATTTDAGDERNPARHRDMPGMDGTFEMPGVQCEACHGPGLEHIATQSKNDIVRIATPRTTEQLRGESMGYGLAISCSECHTRDGEKNYRNDYVSAFNDHDPDGPHDGGRIKADGELTADRSQFDELYGIHPDTSEPLGRHPQLGFSCYTCHDPHGTTKYREEADIELASECQDCHTPTYLPTPPESKMAEFDCGVCHMPPSTKIALETTHEVTGQVRGDMSSHIFKIRVNDDTKTTDDGEYVYPWLSRSEACGWCHNGTDAFEIETFDLSGYRYHLDDLWLPQDNRYIGNDVCSKCHVETVQKYERHGHSNAMHVVKDVDGDGFNDRPTVAAGSMPSDLSPLLLGGVNNSTIKNIIQSGGSISYDDVAYVVGGFMKAAVFVDRDGYVITDDGTGFSAFSFLTDIFETYFYPGISSYVTNNQFDTNQRFYCGVCHSTGWYPRSNSPHTEAPYGMPGMDGWFESPAVGCETCHGPGMKHVVTQKWEHITYESRPRTEDDYKGDDYSYGYGKPMSCVDCHSGPDGERSHRFPTYKWFRTTTQQSINSRNPDIPEYGGRLHAEDGLVAKNSQVQELMGIDPADLAAGITGKHYRSWRNDNPCGYCHNSHVSAYDRDPSYRSYDLTKQCSDCHWTNYNVESGSAMTTGFEGAALECVDCHMPRIVKSGTKTKVRPDGKDDVFPEAGDTRTHIIRIDLSATGSQYFDDMWDYSDPPKEVWMPYLTAKYACLGCHDGDSATDLSGFDFSTYEYHK